MSKKTTIKLKDLEQVLNDIPKTKIEKECNAHACVTPHYEDVVNVESVMYYVNRFLDKPVKKTNKSVRPYDISQFDRRKHGNDDTPYNLNRFDRRKK